MLAFKCLRMEEKTALSLADCIQVLLQALLLTPLLPLFHIQSFLLLLLLILSREQGKKQRAGLSVHRAMPNPLLWYHSTPFVFLFCPFLSRYYCSLYHPCQSNPIPYFQHLYFIPSQLGQPYLYFSFRFSGISSSGVQRSCRNKCRWFSTQQTSSTLDHVKQPIPSPLSIRPMVLACF